MNCQDAKNALLLTDYALFPINNPLTDIKKSCFPPIHGHKNGHSFDIMVRKGDYYYA